MLHFNVPRELHGLFPGLGALVYLLLVEWDIEFDGSVDFNKGISFRLAIVTRVV